MASGSGKDVGVERRLVSVLIGPDVGSTEEQRPEDLLPASQSRPLLFKKDQHCPNQSFVFNGLEIYFQPFMGDC